MILSLGKNMLSFLGVRRPERRDLPNFVAPDHKCNQKHKGEYGKEGHHAIHPAYTDRGDPGVDVKVDRQSQKEAHRVEHQGRLDSMRPETFADVVNRDGDTDERADGDEELGDSHDGPV